jgi:hypothetical protein
VYRCASPDFSLSFIETVSGIDYVRNVSYIVDPNNMAQQAAQICKGQKASDVVWTNTSGLLSTPPFGQASQQQLNPYGYACPYQRTDNPMSINYPDGQFCTEWGNPDAGGYRNWDNILLSWIQVGCCWLLGSCWEVAGRLLGGCWEVAGRLLGQHPVLVDPGEDMHQ